MGRVLIIGAGGVGQVVAFKCAKLPEVFSEICLASRTREKCDKIAAMLPRKIQTAQVDADNVPELVALIQKFKPDVLINTMILAIEAVGIRQQEDIPGANQVGDRSTGVTFVTTWQEVEWRVDGVVLRVGNTGAVVAVIYAEGQQPTNSVIQVAEELASQLETSD